MKFLADHPETRDAAQLWAVPGKAIIASHFFWYSGLSMQKSAQGLFRSLLYDTFRQCPELIPEACPSRWEATDLFYTTRQDWKFAELIECFQAIKINSTSIARFCFFVDGLDEFDGDYTEISQALVEIAKPPRIKLCVASRPLNEFQDHFGANKPSKLLIHELTRRDILGYARSRLQKHPRWNAFNTINTGLKQGVYSLLLRYGADPNAHPTPFTTAWADFIRFAIKHTSEVTAHDSYLEELDAFFKYGADLDASAIGLTLYPGDTTGHLPFRMVTGWDMFCEALEDFTESKTETELAFIARIATKMVKQANSVRWPVGRLPSIIKTVFPEALQQPILDLIFEKQNARKELEIQGKRLFEEVSNVEGTKRLKPNPVDAVMS